MSSLEQFAQDVQYALRIIRRNPAFATVAVLTLALAIGINSAIFSLFDAVLLRMLPVHDPQQLYLLQETGPNANSEAVSFPMFQRCSNALKGTAEILALTRPLCVVRTPCSFEINSSCRAIYLNCANVNCCLISGSLRR